MTNGAEEKLARVTYLPGVQPPSASFASPHLAHDTESTGGGSDTAAGDTAASDTAASDTAPTEADLPLKRLHQFDTGELERLTPAQLQQRMDEITSRPEPEMIVVEPEPAAVPERSARAHNVSMNALARRGVSTVEMSELLKRRELDEPAVELELSRLQAVGLLDDRELANTLVRTLRERKGLGRSAINAELRRRKIDPDAIEEALGEAYETGDDDLSRARELALKRAPQLRSLDPETARRRLGAFLMRKGYSGSIVASAVAAALAPNHPSLRKSSGGPRFE